MAHLSAGDSKRGDRTEPVSGLRGTVDGDIARSETLDVRVSFDRELHARALERVFVPSWQLVPPAVDGSSIQPIVLLEGGLDEPLVLTREGREERLLSNVCTHRGAILAESASDASGLRCRYHGRRFGLDGGMTRCPGFEGAKAFPRPEDDLARLPLHSVGPLRFTSIAGSDGAARDFDTWAAPLRHTLGEYADEPLVFDPKGSRTYEFDASWAVYCENYLEGFHVPFVHPGLNAGLDFSRYRTELLPFGVRQLGFASGDEALLRRPSECGQAADYLWLYPNLMINAYAFGISANVVEPIGVGRTRVRYLRWVARPELAESGVGGALDQVEDEDQAVVVSVQRGIRSRLYPGGRFSPEHETGPHHFHRLLQSDLS